MDSKQHALAAEIRAESAAQRITAKDMQKAVGVSSSAWSNYFVACTRDVPVGIVVDVARVLGMSGSELMRRAEVREAAEPSDSITARLEARLSPQGRKRVEDGLRALAESEAEAGDPPVTTGERTSRSA